MSEKEQPKSAETEPKGKWEPAGLESSKDGRWHIPDEKWGFEEAHAYHPANLEKWWEDPGIFQAYAIHEFDQDGNLKQSDQFACSGIQEDGERE